MIFIAKSHKKLVFALFVAQIGVEVYVCFVHKPCAAWCGVVAREVPVAGTAGYGIMQPVESLEEDIDIGVNIVGS